MIPPQIPTSNGFPWFQSGAIFSSIHSVLSGFGGFDIWQVWRSIGVEFTDMNRFPCRGLLGRTCLSLVNLHGSPRLFLRPSSHWFLERNPNVRQPVPFSPWGWFDEFRFSWLVACGHTQTHADLECWTDTGHDPLQPSHT